MNSDIYILQCLCQLSYICILFLNIEILSNKMNGIIGLLKSSVLKYGIISSYIKIGPVQGHKPCYFFSSSCIAWPSPDSCIISVMVILTELCSLRRVHTRLYTNFKTSKIIYRKIISNKLFLEENK